MSPGGAGALVAQQHANGSHNSRNHAPGHLRLPWREAEVSKLTAPCSSAWREEVWGDFLLLLYCSSISQRFFHFLRLPHHGITFSHDASMGTATGRFVCWRSEERRVRKEVR